MESYFSPPGEASLPLVPPSAPPLADTSSGLDPNTIPRPSLTKKAKVLYDYDAVDKNELSLLADEVSVNDYTQHFTSLNTYTSPYEQFFPLRPIHFASNSSHCAHIIIIILDGLSILFLLSILLLLCKSEKGEHIDLSLDFPLPKIGLFFPVFIL